MILNNLIYKANVIRILKLVLILVIFNSCSKQKSKASLRKVDIETYCHDYWESMLDSLKKGYIPEISSDCVNDSIELTTMAKGIIFYVNTVNTNHGWDTILLPDDPIYLDLMNSKFIDESEDIKMSDSN